MMNHKFLIRNIFYRGQTRGTVWQGGDCGRSTHPKKNCGKKLRKLWKIAEIAGIAEKLRKLQQLRKKIAEITEIVEKWRTAIPPPPLRLATQNSSKNPTN